MTNIFHVDASRPYKEYKDVCYVVFCNKKMKSATFLENNGKYNISELEMLGVISGMKCAEEGDIIMCDNLQVVEELNFKKKPKNLQLFSRAVELMEEKKLKVKKIPRDKNDAGLYLDNRNKKINKSINNIFNPRNLINKSKEKKLWKKRRYSKKKRKL